MNDILELKNLNIEFNRKVLDLIDKNRKMVAIGYRIDIDFEGKGIITEPYKGYHKMWF